MTDASDNARKRCPECGHLNKLSAKNCTNCGHALPEVTVDTAKRRKICPECGTVCHLEARVCTNCGHRFSTDFSAPAARSDAAAAGDGVSMATMITEAPITQHAPEPITLPVQYDAPPDLPPDRVDAAPVATTPPAAAIPAPPIDDGSLGEPAPDLSDLDLDTLRRASPDHKDARGRVILSRFKKDRS